MDKFSIVIPTLWKSTRIYKLINDLIQCDNVDEIILIDNSNEYYKHFDFKPEKINLITPNSNMYVNPSWNYGVEISKNSFVALLNDDINFDVSIFNFFNFYKLDRYGIIGMDSTNYSTEKNEPKIIKESRTKGKYLPQRYGWGCMIIFDKKYWLNIPDNIKIWFGDDFIRNLNKSPISYLTDFKIETDMSTTSDEPIWNEQKQIDNLNFVKLFR